ncbi:MAG: tyrosine-type recombinase/integrase [Tyzzerella sp.]|nr:tyrosine-type recombinase/integrase [Tyzzerella sp.]
MKMPNGYGSVVNLGKNRRKPWAVRVTTGYRLNANGTCTQTYKYLEYFEKRKDAFAYLAAYNSGQVVKEHEALSDIPTFKEIYESWIEYKKSRKKPISNSTARNYDIAFNMLSDIHHKRINIITLDDLNLNVAKYSDKSKSTLGFIRTVLKQSFDYAIKRGHIEKNITNYVDYEYTESEEEIHKDFSLEEIEKLWELLPLYPDIKFALILCYTGMRPQEMVKIKTENVFINKRYMIGGIKSEAGTNRKIPLHKKIIPLIEELYNSDNEYLVMTPNGIPYSYSNFRQNVWKPLMLQISMDHLMHDGRHTLSTGLKRVGADNLYRKLIMGHSIEDLTDRVYTHVPVSELVKTIDMLDY